METERKDFRMFSLEERERAVELYFTTPMTAMAWMIKPHSKLCSLPAIARMRTVHRMIWAGLGLA